MEITVLNKLDEIVDDDNSLIKFIDHTGLKPFVEEMEEYDEKLVEDGSYYKTSTDVVDTHQYTHNVKDTTHHNNKHKHHHTRKILIRPVAALHCQRAIYVVPWRIPNVPMTFSHKLGHLVPDRPIHPVETYMYNLMIYFFDNCPRLYIENRHCFQRYANEMTRKRNVTDLINMFHIAKNFQKYHRLKANNEWADPKLLEYSQTERVKVPVFVDELQIANVSRSYDSKENDPENSSDGKLHLGALKLMFMEMSAFTDFKGETLYVYAGASPGHHIALFAEYFREHIINKDTGDITIGASFHIYDPEFGNNFAAEIQQYENVHINPFFSEELDQRDMNLFTQSSSHHRRFLENTSAVQDTPLNLRTKDQRKKFTDKNGRHPYLDNIGYFTSAIAKHYMSEKCDALRRKYKNLVFVSDIRGNISDPKRTYIAQKKHLKELKTMSDDVKMKTIDKLTFDYLELTEDIIAWDMQQQRRWVSEMKPNIALLKFRPSYVVKGSKQFTAKKFTYWKGRQYLPLWAGTRSTECYLEIKPEIKKPTPKPMSPADEIEPVDEERPYKYFTYQEKIDYDTEMHENLFYNFNMTLRVARYSHSTLHKIKKDWNYDPAEYGFCKCYDCTRTQILMEEVSQKVQDFWGYPITFDSLYSQIWKACKTNTHQLPLPSVMS